MEKRTPCPPMNSQKTFGHGVVIGKFLPPHHGHEYLIRTALAQCKKLTVIVCGKPSDPIPPNLRFEWLRELFPAAKIMLIDDRYDENDSRIWAENTIRWLGRAPDAVFTSEHYGDAYADHLGCQHILVDQPRTTIPVSGTAVREDPFGNWQHISPPVRAWFAKRIVVLGAESTGTTTLARDLAAHFQTDWVPEYGRELTQTKLNCGNTEWTSEEFLHVAKEQTRRENFAARSCNHLLICDTNALATHLWHRRYMNFDNPSLKAFSDSVKPHLYLLTGDEIPFVQDGLRDGEHIRHEMHHWFSELLETTGVPWALVQGSPAKRLTQAIQSISKLLS